MRRNFCFCVLMGLMLLGFSSTVVSQFGDPVPRHPQEMDGPVNLITGALFFSETDIAVPGRGLGIEFTRYYNSDGVIRSTNNETSYMGHKWSHSYEWRVGGSGYYAYVITGSGARQRFGGSAYQANRPGWQNRVTYSPPAGVRASLRIVQSGEAWAYIYTTRGGIRYKFELLFEKRVYVLTEVSDPNGNRLKLHYEAPPERNSNVFSLPRLVAVEDTQGRILKFYYGVQIDDVDYPRFISKIEFGLGTPAALTTVHQTVNYSYSRYRYKTGGPFWDPTYRNYYCLASVDRQLGSGDPRGTALTTQYEYNRSSLSDYINFGNISAVISPLGYRTEFDDYVGIDARGVRVRDVPPDDSTDGDVLYMRNYSRSSSIYGGYRGYVCNRDPEATNRSQRYCYNYKIGSGLVTLRTDINLTHGSNNSSTSYWDYLNRNLYSAYRIYFVSGGGSAVHNAVQNLL